ncbi:sn-glycerol-3-phosphate ABC transporter permease UgpE [Pikeienuella piscinae]|uniref:sn-glycerol-3-phosphate transport system permease protein UgpE n=1 Tax=Pikeienuella piscinae TaxID=2748098 RepID=A0A7L5BUM9_9RHOB|nr:sn-glycerol-3-phosphate ABC transporter permease UgpE [Pikeienuella piscinae]QIE54981.1 sn-glycerol-3-phosphate ABC transporter permease UgpE [Pikeienuella piscinae]
MVGDTRWSRYFAHAVLITGVLVIALPVWITFVGSTHTTARMLQAPVPLWPGSEILENYRLVLFEGFGQAARTPIWQMIVNSFVVALGICIGKISISIIAAFAIVYFNFRFRMTAFWLIFLTLMLPVEVRIVPTYQVVADFRMLNSYGGMIVPLIASATATFMFRQFFMTVPVELIDAAKIDGASPMKFFWHIILPMSRTTIAALFVIQFIYGWNQYLWPLLVTSSEDYYTIVMTVARQANELDGVIKWNLIMAVAMLAMIPPVVVVIMMQKQFVRGLVDSDK